MWQYIIQALSAILVAIIGGVFARDVRRRKKADEKIQARAEMRAEESRLSMEMMSASIDLGVATALAVEKHEFNGEMKRAKEKASMAQANYESFLQRITARQVTK